MKKPNKNKEISEEYLRRAALFHLQKFDATEAGLRKVLERRVMSGCYQTDRNPEDYSDAINTVVQHCIDLSYVNDQRYAERLVEVSSERGMSKRQIQAKLLQKGVSSDLIEQTIDESDTDDLDAAIAYARKKKDWQISCCPPNRLSREGPCQARTSRIFLRYLRKSY